jgi:hypothetical protein
MGEAEGGFLIQAEIVDALGERVGGGWQRTVAADALPRVPDLATADEDGLAGVGGELFGLLNGGELVEAWRQGVGRLALDVRADRLRALPWELLVDSDDKCPFSRTEQPAVRGTLPYPVTLAELAVPIHLMIVVGDPDDPAVDSAAEIDAIYRGLRGAPCCWQVDVLFKPSREELRDAFTEVLPHVFHFVGHGTSSGGSPALKIVADSGEWDLTARFVARALGDQPPPRLVVLNACRTAGQSAVRGVSDAFLKEGAAAVVSTQGDVATVAAVRFAETLYYELACGRAVDVAVAEARGKLEFATGMSPADWALPVVETVAEPGTVLRHTRRWELKEVLQRYHELKDVPHLVDRSADRRRVHRGVGVPANGLLYVTGAEQAGKSMLGRSYLLTRLVSGGPVVYVSLEGRTRVSTDDFVRMVAEEAKRWLDASAAPLCDELLGALSGQPQGPPMLSARPVGTFTLVDPRYQKLQGLLVNLARTKPLVLLLDDVTLVNDHDAFVNGLLAPAARGELHGVQVIVVGGRDRLRELTGERVTPHLEIEVRKFAKQDAVLLVREYLARRRPDEVVAADQAKWARFDQLMLEWAEERVMALNDLLAPFEVVNHGSGYLAEVGLQ